MGDQEYTALRQQSLELQRQRFTVAGIAAGFVATALSWVTRADVQQLHGVVASTMLLAVLSAFIVLSLSMSFGISMITSYLIVFYEEAAGSGWDSRLPYLQFFWFRKRIRTTWFISVAYLILGIVVVWVPNVDPQASGRQFVERFLNFPFAGTACAFIFLLGLFFVYPATGWGLQGKWKGIRACEKCICLEADQAGKDGVGMGQYEGCGLPAPGRHWWNRG